jgi:hypothetical protein
LTDAKTGTSGDEDCWTSDPNDAWGIDRTVRVADEWDLRRNI